MASISRCANIHGAIVNAKNRSMFPYRRNGGKNRSRSSGGGRRQGNNRRGTPNSPMELLPTLQPTTKALAQCLAGNTKASGQIVHARNVLAQAQRYIDERNIDRMPPAAREEYLEQVARLKLTLSDAADIEEIEEQEAAEEAAADKVEPVSMERLRELAMSLAEPQEQVEPGPQMPKEDDEPKAQKPSAPAAAPSSSKRSEDADTLRLKVTRSDGETDDSVTAP